MEGASIESRVLNKEGASIESRALNKDRPLLSLGH